MSDSKNATWSRSVDSPDSGAQRWCWIPIGHAQHHLGRFTIPAGDYIVLKFPSELEKVGIKREPSSG